MYNPQVQTVGGYEPSPSSPETPPQQWLDEVFKARGYSTENFPALETGYYNPPTSYQQASYGIKLVSHCRSHKPSDVLSVASMLKAGLSPNPCNRFGESLIHMLCRRGNKELLRVLLSGGCSIQVCDDFGRTPLHDACWTSDPDFEIVELLLDRDLRLLHVSDGRGSTPLDYVKRSNWGKWKAFFTRKFETYWAPRDVSADGPEPSPPLALLSPGSKPIPEPENRLPDHIAVLISNGKIPTPSCEEDIKVVLMGAKTKADATEGKPKEIDDTGRVLQVREG